MTDKKGNHFKFKKLIRQQRNQLKNQLERVRTPSQINEFTQNLIALLRNSARKVYRYKKVKPAANYNYWTTDLKIKRKKLTALRRKFKTVQPERAAELREIYHKNLAEFKLELGLAKRKAWQNFAGTNLILSA